MANPSGWVQVRLFLAAAVDPALDGTFLLLVAQAAATTLAFAITGTAMALVIGAAGGLVVSRAWWADGDDRPRRWRRGAWWTSRSLLSVPRGVHEVVWGLALVAVLGADPLVAVLAIGLPFGAVTAKVFAELLDEADPAPALALRAAGAGRGGSILVGLVPSVAGEALAYGAYRLECAVRAAAILGLIGAGGLGFELALSFSSLRYDQMWTLMMAVIALCGSIEWAGFLLRRRFTAAPRDLRMSSEISSVPDVRADTGQTGPTRAHPLMEPSGPPGHPVFAGPPPALGRGEPTGPDRRGGHPRLGVAFAALAVAVVGAAAWHLRLDPSSLWSQRTRRLASEVAMSAWPPRLGSGGAGELAGRAIETLAMSVLAISLASILAAGLVGVMVWSAPEPAMRRGARSPGLPGRTLHSLVRGGSRLVLLISRSVPPPVWAFVVLFVLLPGPLPAAAALGIYNFGVMGRLLADGVAGLDPAPASALARLGAGRSGVVLAGVAPAAAGRFVAYSLYRWEVTVRESVVVGLVAAGGLGSLLTRQLAAFDYRSALPTLGALIGLTIVVDMISAAARAALRTRVAG
ncbi:MAG: PhnE/PtxC family ABC transporter permease [Acidimicrobiales bacterium]